MAEQQSTSQAIADLARTHEFKNALEQHQAKVDQQFEQQMRFDQMLESLTAVIDSWRNETAAINSWKSNETQNAQLGGFIPKTTPMALNQGAEMVGDFNNLEQTDELEDYNGSFEDLRAKMIVYNPSLPEEYFVSKYIGGLRAEIRPLVKIGRPIDLVEAKDLARLHFEVVREWIPEYILVGELELAWVEESAAQNLEISGGALLEPKDTREESKREIESPAQESEIEAIPCEEWSRKFESSPKLVEQLNKLEISFNASVYPLPCNADEGSNSKVLDVPKDPTNDQVQKLQDEGIIPCTDKVELSKVNSSSTTISDCIPKEMGQLLVLLIELIEIRLANLNLNSIGCLGVFRAHKVFVKMPTKHQGLSGLVIETILVSAYRCLNSMGKASCSHSLVFDPGGNIEVLDGEIGECREIDIGSIGRVEYNWFIDALFSCQCIEDQLILRPFDRGKRIMYNSYCENFDPWILNLCIETVILAVLVGDSADMDSEIDGNSIDVTQVQITLAKKPIVEVTLIFDPGGGLVVMNSHLKSLQECHGQPCKSFAPIPGLVVMNSHLKLLQECHGQPCKSVAPISVWLFKCSWVCFVLCVSRLDGYCLL